MGISEIMLKKTLAYKQNEYSLKGWENVDKVVQLQTALSSTKETSKIFLGTECFTPNKEGWVFQKDEIFPLREIEFEGKKFYCPNKTELLLFRNFGNFYDYRITHSHLNFNSLQESDVLKLINRLKKESE